MDPILKTVVNATTASHVIGERSAGGRNKKRRQQQIQTSFEFVPFDVFLLPGHAADVQRQHATAQQRGGEATQQQGRGAMLRKYSGWKPDEINAFVSWKNKPEGANRCVPPFILNANRHSDGWTRPLIEMGGRIYKPLSFKLGSE